jgi:hypothetical protein
VSRSTRVAIFAGLVLLCASPLIASCTPLRNYGRATTIALKCSPEGKERRGGEPGAVPVNPVPTTPADSIARPKTTAAAIACDGGLPR